LLEVADAALEASGVHARRQRRRHQPALHALDDGDVLAAGAVERLLADLAGGGVAVEAAADDADASGRSF